MRSLVGLFALSFAGLLGTSPQAQILDRPAPLGDLNAVSAGGTVDLGSGFRPIGTVPTTTPTLLFAATDGDAGCELWRTDGTVAGTVRYPELVPGPGGSDPEGFAHLADRTALVFMSHPLFGCEVHRVRPGAATPEPVADTAPGPRGWVHPLFGPSGQREAYWAGVQERPGGGYDFAAYSTDGTTATELARLPNVPRQAVQFAEANGRLVVALDDGVRGTELWSLDMGTGVLTRLEDRTPGPAGSDFAFVRTLGNAVVAGAHPHGVPTLLATDGAALPGVLGTFAPGTRLGTDALAAGGELYFGADSGSGEEPHLSDGTASGTRQLQDVVPGPSGSSPRFIAVHAGAAWGTCAFPNAGVELAEFDRQGANLRHDAAPGAASGNPFGLVSFPTDLRYVADDGTGPQVWSLGLAVQRLTALSGLPADPFAALALADLYAFAWSTSIGEEPLVVGPSAPGGLSLGNIEPARPLTLPSSASGYRYSRGSTYFAATDGVHGGELWATRGDAASTRRLTDYAPGPASAQIFDLIELGSGLYCSATNGTVGTEPHTFDPMTETMTVLRDIVPGPSGSLPRDAAGPFRVRHAPRPLVYFSAEDPQSGREPFVTDGTPAGTRLLRNLAPAAEHSDPRDFVQLRDLVLFTATTSVTGRELFFSDGTTGGTQIVQDIRPGADSSDPQWLTVVGDFAYFAARHPQFRVELFRTDGTPQGTVLVRDIHPTSDSFPSGLTKLETGFGPVLLFAARDRDHGVELWRSAGTAQSTVMVADLMPGSASSSPEGLVAAGNKVFFAAVAPFSLARALYVTDGLDVVRLPGVRDPSGMRAVGGAVVFLGTDERGDREPWVSDGTHAGTRRIADVRVGAASSRVLQLAVEAGSVYFTAEDGVRGHEPYVIPRFGATVESVGTPCGPSMPTLDGTPPVLGGTMTLRGDRAPANHRAVLLLSGEASGPVFDLPGGCPIPLDLATPIVLTSFDTGAGGTWSVPLMIPDAAAIGRDRFVIWVLYVPLMPGDFSATNAIVLAPGLR